MHLCNINSWSVLNDRNIKYLISKFIISITLFKCEPNVFHGELLILRFNRIVQLFFLVSFFLIK